MVTQPRWLRALSLAAATSLVSALAVAIPVAAQADTAPPSPSTPTTVSSDALPTVQVDGVVWTQIIVGNTVYVGGSFTQAQPAGAAAGVGEVPRTDMLAYNLTTGTLITSFAPTLDGQVLGLAASVDGKTVYAVGDFKTVNGVHKYGAVALDATTGATLTKFSANANSGVNAVAVSGSRVYLGGAFTSLNGVARTRVAAVDPTTGAVQSWAPVVADHTVRALVVSPDGSQVVLAGSFSSLNGSSRPGSGIGAVDATTGANRPWAAGNLLYDHGTKSAFYSLWSDGTNVYGTGYVYGSVSDGNLEGSFSASWNGGTINWIEDCHGDTYSIATLDDAVYTVSHAHYCGNVPDGFQQSLPNTSASIHQRALAFSKQATGTLLANNYGSSTTYSSFGGQPAPTLLTWYPTLTAGTFTGQSQAAWSVTAGNGYVLLGGEFPKVNGTRQTGLVRFAQKSIAPNHDGPKVSGSNWTPTAVSLTSGSVRVSWPANYDQDNAYLKYSVYRNGGSTPVFTTTAKSLDWWYRPDLGFTDTGLTPGSTVSYKVKATDPFGNSASSATVTATVAAAPQAATSAYANVVRADGAQDLWRLGESAGTTAYDSAGYTDLNLGSGVGLGASGAIAGDPDTAATFSGASTAFAATRTAAAAPNTFSIEAWFKTTSTTGGKIVGFGSANSGNSSTYDRHIYMDTAGRILFGVNPGAKVIEQSASGYNDGKWHQVVASLSGAGMQLFVDGKSVANRTDTTQGQSMLGYWRIGGDASWSGAADFTGSIDDVSLYPTALTAGQVANHFSAGTTATVSSTPVAAFAASASGTTVSVDASGSTDTGGSLTSYDWTYGDGSTGSGVTAKHTYASAGTYTVTLTVTDDHGATSTVTKSVTTGAANVAPTAKFTATPSGLTAAFDGTGSTDSDGTVTGYAWTFGDGATATGSTVSHTYDTAGTYTVTLTVTDDGGLTGKTTQEVNVAAPGSTSLAADAFGRTVTGGFGSADQGGSWTVSSTAASAFSVGSGAAAVSTAAAATRTAYLGAVSSSATDVSATITVPAMPVGGSLYAGVLGRRVGSDDYNGRVIITATGAVQVQVLHGSAALKSVTLSGVTATAGTTLRIRLETTGTGTTTLKARAWLASAAEPSAWQVTSTDTTAALQTAGSVGLRSYLGSGVTNGPLAVGFDDFAATVVQ